MKYAFISPIVIANNCAIVATDLPANLLFTMCEPKGLQRMINSIEQILTFIVDMEMLIPCMDVSSHVQNNNHHRVGRLYK